MTDQLRIDRDDRGVVTLTMDRPEVRNAFGPDLIGALADALADLAQDDTVRVLVLTGAGKVFSAGADLNWMRSMVDYSREEQIADSHQLDGLMHSMGTRCLRTSDCTHVMEVASISKSEPEDAFPWLEVEDLLSATATTKGHSTSLVRTEFKSINQCTDPAFERCDELIIC